MSGIDGSFIIVSVDYHHISPHYEGGFPNIELRLAVTSCIA